MSLKLPRSVEHLARATESGETFEYLMFFGATPGTELTRACLSNWWAQSFEVDGGIGRWDWAPLFYAKI